MANAKTAIVTGAGTGIGKAVATALLKAGWNTVFTGRRVSLLEEAVAAAGKTEARALALAADVTQTDEVDRLFDGVVKEFGRVDLLFNNAGRGFKATLIDELPVETWNEVVAVNLTGSFLCARAAFRVMRKQSPQGGRIINNGSVSAHAPRPGSATRSSLVGWSTEVRAMKQGGGHWRWGINGRAVTSGFEVNDLGFQLRSDVASTANWVGYTHFQPGRVVRQWEVWGNSWGRWTFDGAREQLAANLWSNVQFQNGWMLMSEARREFSRMSPTLLRGGPATYVPPNVLWWTRLVSDPRRLVSGELVTQGYVDDVGGGYRAGLFPLITVRPSARAELSLQPGVRRARNPSQYVDLASAGNDTSYVTGALAQTTASLTARVNVTFTPTLSFQLYAQPFLSTGNYSTLGEVRDARAKRLTRRIGTFAPGAVSPVGDDALRIDRGAGRTPIELDDPDFTVRALKSNAVLRWEYRPGSAVFLVWAQARDNDADRGNVSLSRQAKDLWRTPGTNVLLIKASYWITP